MKSIDFYFDYSSPFAYLASERMEALAQRAGATLNWKPMLLGGVFRAVGTPMVPLFEFAEEKQAYIRLDMERWAHWFDIPLRWPSRFPRMTVKPLRATLLLHEDPAPFIHRCFRAYWEEDRDISDIQVLAEICEELSLRPNLLEDIGQPVVKQALIDATQEAVEAGVFGAPTCVVNGQVFWGQDRLHFVERALGGWNPTLD